MYLGALTKSFSWLGHRFYVRTLTIGEMLEVAEISGRWAQTVSAGKAYQAAVVAACLRTVDGQPLAVPLTDDPNDSPLAAKFEYVRSHWFPPTIDHVYNQFLDLDEQVQRVVVAMGEASGQTGP